MRTVMSFTNDTAFAYLWENGHVYTFREHQRTEPHGLIWVSRGRGELKEFDGVCEEVESRVPPTEAVLSEYAPESGFGTDTDWREAISEVNDGLPNGGFIYRVDRHE